MSVDALVARVAGEDNALLFADNDGNSYRLVPVGDAVSITKNGSTVGGIRRKVVAKTASYTLTEADCGTVFTNRGASGAVTFTLPAVATSNGLWYEFFVVAGQDVTIDGPADTLVVFNDAAADSVAFSTTSEKIGGAVTAICDGTSWLIMEHIHDAQTSVIAT